jgi:hypothetical protein
MREISGFLLSGETRIRQILGGRARTEWLKREAE